MDAYHFRFKDVGEGDLVYTIIRPEDVPYYECTICGQPVVTFADDLPEDYNERLEMVMELAKSHILFACCPPEEPVSNNIRFIRI